MVLSGNYLHVQEDEMHKQAELYIFRTVNACRIISLLGIGPTSPLHEQIYYVKVHNPTEWYSDVCCTCL